MKHADKIPCCLFPSTISFVDDSRSFLEQAACMLQMENAYNMFRLKPVEALKTVNMEYPPTDSATEVYNDKRHSRISILTKPSPKTSRGIDASTPFATILQENEEITMLHGNPVC